jgi:hypothetical protein
VRVRKRRRGSRRRSGRGWFWVPVVAGILLVVALAGAFLVRDLLLVRQSLLTAQASLSDVRSAAGAIDLEAAEVALVRADDELAVARSRAGGPLWSLGARVPIVGDSIDVTRAVVGVATASLDVARVAVDEGSQLLAGGVDVEVTDGQIDLSPVQDASELLAGLPLEQMVTARDQLRAVEPDWAPQEVIDGRRETLRLADETIESIELGRELLAALPSFLGADGPRSYFLGVQTPAELRGTGGLIGYFVVLTVDEGGFELSPSEVYDAIEDDVDDAPVTGRIAQLAGDITQGAVVDEEYRDRYEHTAAAGLFSNVNVDPDLPTSAAVALDLFEVRTGQRLDGVILLDPVALQSILEAIGEDLPIPTELAGEAELPERLAPEDFARFVMVDIYEQLGSGRGPERKLLLRTLGDVAFAQVFDGGWDGVAVSRALGAAAGERHLQLHSRDEDEQASFGRLGVGGRLQPADGADLLSVTANNAVGGKMDVHLGHEVTVDVTLDDPRRQDDQVTLQRAMTVRTEVDNPLPSEGMDPYVIGNCLVGEGTNRCFDGPSGENRTWFSVWAPEATELQAERADDGRTRVRTGTIRGLSVIDRYLDTPSQSRRGFELDLAGPAPAWTDTGELNYAWTWWAQSKAIPTLLDVTISPPDGWRIVDAEVAGGGDGRGFGVHGEGVPLEIDVDAQGRATLRGTVTADTTLHLRMSGAEG